MTGTRTNRAGLAALIAVVLLGGLAVAFGVVRLQNASAGETLVLEQAGEPGDSPFAPPLAAQVQPKAPAGDGAPGVNLESEVCDPEDLIAQLRADPAKAASWTSALNSDPTLRWSGGTTVTVEQIPDFIRELAPRTLPEDLRVTNYRYTAGAPTSVQSVLQKGTAVLVDQSGVARVRCKCGNPLTPKKTLVSAPRYVGEPWPGFTKVQVVVVEDGAPRCDEGEYYADGRCRDVPRCEDGGYFRDGACRAPPRCDRDEYPDGDGCAPLRCDGDEYADDGFCKPLRCPEGQFPEDGQCRDEPSPPGEPGDGDERPGDVPGDADPANSSGGSDGPDGSDGSGGESGPTEAPPPVPLPALVPSQAARTGPDPQTPPSTSAGGDVGSAPAPSSDPGRPTGVPSTGADPSTPPPSGGAGDPDPSTTVTAPDPKPDTTPPSTVVEPPPPTSPPTSPPPAGTSTEPETPSVGSGTPVPATSEPTTPPPSTEPEPTEPPTKKADPSTPPASTAVEPESEPPAPPTDPPTKKATPSTPPPASTAVEPEPTPTATPSPCTDRDADGVCDRTDPCVDPDGDGVCLAPQRIR
ncbi:DUF6777 domain-containing protein [Pseudonocardia sp.]|uniref:DUF6777 domain-containing protein n=1 Tax=Pseudonocardia sp. TaxID=60912 RepID=UPI003D0B5084